jgi:hypothetical protein
MPKRMPRFDRALSSQAQLAVAIVHAGEVTRISGGPLLQKEWTQSRLEALYELAYLRVFATWEACLEGLFYRSLCGYASAAGQETLVNGRYFPSVTVAEAAVLGPKRSYLLWHNPQQIIDRCRGYIRSGAPGCPAVLESTISSNLTHLLHMSYARHRIVHDQTDAKKKFDAATVQIAGRTYAASRPGRFLRDWDTSAVPTRRWIDALISDLAQLMSQLV